jgi:hypothetical protein
LRYHLRGDQEVKMRKLVAVMLLWASPMPAQNPGTVKPNPVRVRALWLAIKARLTDAKGAEFFQSMKNTALPYLAGTLVSTSPAEKPNRLVLAMSDAGTSEVTLRLRRGSFPGPLEIGSRVEFIGGEPMEFEREPFMLTLDISLRSVELTAPPPQPPPLLKNQ